MCRRPRVFVISLPQGAGASTAAAGRVPLTVTTSLMPRAGCRATHTASSNTCTTGTKGQEALQHGRGSCLGKASH
ncbi:hypothetical protein NDU88_002214 [Pleurodeles waltl]|uniref:Secreted protein n=1 Tax=Pleurodeles waltl TaxID=8319 RepID=A0AAV7KU41_PLEWA|nr:hypothetical protein NDU88_002214 [Pleurodeles waltl]